MLVLQIYFALAFSVALLLWLEHFWPAVQEARSKGIVNELTESRILASVVFIIITTILAPFVVMVVLSPMRAQYFKIGLQRIIEEDRD